MSGLGATRESPKFLLRLPDDMRDRIAEAAKSNGRSMNAEIVARLQASFDHVDTDLPERTIRRIADEAAKSAVVEVMDSFSATSFRVVKVDDRLSIVVDGSDKQ